MSRSYSERSYNKHYTDSQGFIRVGKDNSHERTTRSGIDCSTPVMRVVIRYTKTELLDLFHECKPPEHLLAINDVCTTAKPHAVVEVGVPRTLLEEPSS